MKLSVGKMSTLCLAITGALVLGCHSRDPASICPVEVWRSRVQLGGVHGLDVLVVVDNSSSMDQERGQLATRVYSLVNAMVYPLASTRILGADDLRIAVVSSDMGLQWGGNLEAPVGEFDHGCDAREGGDNGRFQGYQAQSVDFVSGIIPCDSGVKHCPRDWRCSEGVCRPPADGSTGRECPALEGPVAEMTKWEYGTLVAGQAACLANLDVSTCTVEQPLEAAIAGLRHGKRSGFIREHRPLLLVVVSDEDDCSLKDKGLFETEQWKTGGGDGADYTCHDPHRADAESFLYPASRYYEEIQKILGFDDSIPNWAFFFLAIVGVPPTEDCQGSGDELGSCLESEEMQLRLEESADVTGTGRRLRPACTMVDQGKIVAEATPGRRFVKVAQQFGSEGYVHSICDPDWNSAFETIADRFDTCFCGGDCFWSQLRWDPENKTVSECQLLAKYAFVEPGRQCPEAFRREFYEEGGDVKSRQMSSEKYESSVMRQVVSADDGTQYEEVYCPIPQIPVDIDCEVAHKTAATLEGVYPGAFGWYYCEGRGEDYVIACRDGEDNDGDGRVDDEDPDCAGCVAGDEQKCPWECQYEVRFTPATRHLTPELYVQCRTRPSKDGEGCGENPPTQIE